MTEWLEGGVLLRYVSLLRLGCGKTFVAVGGTSLDLLDLRWVMGLRSDFGMTCGARMRL
jgi:hypothetical protein